jgi:hypothetical protein
VINGDGLHTFPIEVPRGPKSKACSRGASILLATGIRIQNVLRTRRQPMSGRSQIA